MLLEATGSDSMLGFFWPFGVAKTKNPPQNRHTQKPVDVPVIVTHFEY